MDFHPWAARPKGDRFHYLPGLACKMDQNGQKLPGVKIKSSLILNPDAPLCQSSRSPGFKVVHF